MTPAPDIDTLRADLDAYRVHEALTRAVAMRDPAPTGYEGLLSVDRAHIARLEAALRIDWRDPLSSSSRPE